MTEVILFDFLPRKEFYFGPDKLSGFVSRVSPKRMVYGIKRVVD